MKEPIEILALARPAIDAAAIESCAREAGYALVSVARSMDEAQASLAARAAGAPRLVLLVEQDLMNQPATAEAVRALGVPVACFTAGEPGPDAAPAGSEQVTCGLAPRELALAVALAAARWERDRAERERQDLAEALFQSQKRYEALFQQVPVFIIELDVTEVEAYIRELRDQGITALRAHFAEEPTRALAAMSETALVRVNDAALRVFGVRDLAELQQNQARVHTPHSLRAAGEILAAYAEGACSWEYETEYATLSGEPVWALCRAVFPTSRMMPRHVFLCGVDVTERKHSEEEIRALNRALSRRATELEAINAELESFSYSVSHDLRAPLRAIDGFSKLLIDRYADQMDERGGVYLARVREASHRMARLIDDLLQLSRMTRSEMHVQLCDLSVMAREIVGELQQTSPERRVEVVIQPGLVVEADPTLLRAALENLLGNAWKFTSKKADARIEVGATIRGDRPAYFVRDNGAGFDMAYAQKLFGAFQRLHGAHEFEGTGIGLATVQRIVRRHGGEVWGEGAVNQGATFTFTLG